MDQEPDKFSKPIDFFVIDKFLDPLTQKIQRNIGLDCFFWAKTLLLICVLFLVVSIMFLIPIMSINPDVFIFFLIAGDFVFLILCRHRLRCQECGVNAIRKRVYDEVRKGKRNPLVFGYSRMYPAFLFWVLTIPLDLMHGFTTSLFLLFIKTPFLMYYIFQCLISCTPLPPQKSKLRKALENLKEKMAEVMGGNPLPEPA